MATIVNYDSREQGAPFHESSLQDWIRTRKLAGCEIVVPYTYSGCGRPLSHPSMLRRKLRGYAYCPGCKTFLKCGQTVEHMLENQALAQGADTRADYPAPEEARKRIGRGPVASTIPMFDFIPYTTKNGSAK